MGMYKYLAKLWKQPKKELGGLWKEHLIQWRREGTVIRIEKPTRLDRARSIGYKAKKGFVVARVKLLRGGRKRTQIKKGRRTKTQRRRKIVGKNYQWVAEEKAQRTFKNLEVLNSYPLAKDGIFYWFEVILIDPCAPEIKSDKNMKWVTQPQHKNRVLRGKTSAGRKSRGLRGKGKGHEKNRPSLNAHSGRGKC
ncbi:MAG: 50S ribosomal protein L15e [archaeon]